MEVFIKEKILSIFSTEHSRHFASEPHIRIQVITIESNRGTELLTDKYHGELLIICLKGKLKAVSKTATAELNEGDQVLFFDGEPFQIHTANPDGTSSLAQFIWTPGNNPCKFCFEQNKTFFPT
jgi:hypothetical protein